MNLNQRFRAERITAARLSQDGRRHSQLAMQAAQDMAATRRKAQTGRVVCHHLLRMLSCESGGRGAEFTLTQPFSADIDLQESAAAVSTLRLPGDAPSDSRQTQQQYSLGF